MRSSLRPLRLRPFRLLFAARTVSIVGTAIAPVALAFAILDLTGSKADLGLVLVARTLPQVLFLLAGGVIADRLPRHLVMIAANAGSAVAQGSTAALLLSGHATVGSLGALAALNGVASGFFFPASQGVLPQLVPESMRQEANSLLRLGLNAGTIGGSALGGVLVAATSPGAAIAVDAATYVAAAALLVPLRLPALASGSASFVRELREGWDEFAGRTWLWSIVLQFSVVNGAVSGCEGVLGPAVAKDHLGGAAGWGLVLSAEGAGLIAGGVLMLRLRPRRLLLAATLGIFVTLPVLAALAVPLTLPVVAAASFVAGVGIETFGVLWDTAMQQEIPHDRLSRVYSYDALGSFVFIPVGLAVVGPLAGLIGTATTLWLAAAVIGAATLAVLLVHEVRTLERRSAAPRATT